MAVPVTPDVIGSRLKAARTRLNLKQEEVASKIDLARTTLIAIEAGKRPARPAELRALCAMYQIRESELLSGARQPLDLEVKFRATGEIGSSALNSAKQSTSALLNRLAASALELEEMLGCPVPKVDYPAWHLNHEQSLEDQAEDAALLFRQRLGLGLGPLPDLKALLELEFGFRVFERALPAAISGACSFNGAFGAFVLLNANHWPERRQQTMAHEAAHGMVRPGEPLIILESDELATREDKFCDAVARAILLPAVSVRRKSAELKGLSKLTVRHILWLAAYFRVSIEAMARRMEALGLINKGVFESLKGRQLGRRHLEEVMRDAELHGLPNGFTPRLLFLASEAYAQGLLSEQQIAERLELSLPAVRSALDSASELNEL